MSFLPPVVLEIRANAAQFYAETAKVAEAVKAMGTETSAAATGMSDKVTAATAEMGNRVAAATEGMAAKATTETEAMARRVIAEAEQMDAGTTAATEDMIRKVVAGFDTMSAQTAAAMERQTVKTTAAIKAQGDEIVASQERTAVAVESAATKISASLKEEGGAATRAASETRAAGLSMQETFAKTALSAAGATGAMSSALAHSAATQLEAAKASQASIMGIANGITKVAGVTAIVMAGIGLDMAAHFQKATTLLVTAGGESKNQLESVRKGILDISADTGTSAEQLSEGMYVMEKAGYRGAAGLAALRASAEGAKAENVDLGIMTQATTDILLDYGYKMGNAKDATESSVTVVNQLVAASGAAKTTMQDFANSMAAVVPIASAAHISFKEVGGALATMTQHGQTAQQSSQNLANLIQSLIRPNNMASAAMQQMGIDTVDLAQHLGDAGLSGTLKKVQNAVLDHMGPAGLVVMDTMKKSASATAALKTEITKLPPDLANMAQGLLDGTESVGGFQKAAKGAGGSAGATALQFLSLYKSSQGVNDAMKSGQPAMMTYQAAMTKMLGNVTAARAATMLLMNNSEDLNRSIQLVADAADKSGNHIETWGETQAQLSTQLDMAKQRTEKLAIEIGTALIPAANGALSGFQDLFDGFQKGDPILMSIAGVIGGAMVLSISAYTVKLVQAGIASVTQMALMGKSALTMGANFVEGFLSAEVAASSFSGKAGSLGGMVRSNLLPALGGIGAVAAIGAAGLAIVGANSKSATVPIETMTAALDDLANKQGKVAKVRIDQAFSQWNTVMGQSTSQIDSMDGAIEKFTHRDLGAVINDWADNALQPLVAGFGVVKGEAGQLDDKFKEVGDSLAGMVKDGKADSAAKAFDHLSETFIKNGKSAQDALDTMPGYKQSLIDVAAAAGQTLSPTELLEMAMGKLPASMQKAADAGSTYTDSAGNVRGLNEDVKKSLDDLGISIDGQITNLGNLYDAMVKTGLANLSARDAEFHFGDAVQKATQQASELKTQLNGDLSSALNKTKTDFNKTTTAGQAAESAFSSVTQAGLQNASIMAHDVTKSQKDVQGALKNTYDDMIQTAEKFGLGSTKAEELTRKVLGIPKGVKIDSWMADTAKRMAEKTKGAMDAIDGKTVNTYVNHHETTLIVTDHVDNFGRGTGGKQGTRPTAFWTGGQISGLAGGGGVNDAIFSGLLGGRSPLNPREDNILAMVGGKPLKLRSNEFVVNEPQTKANLPWLKAINAGLKMEDVMRHSSQIMAAQKRFAVAKRETASQHMGITNNYFNTTNNVVIHSTADAKSLAREFSRITANKF